MVRQIEATLFNGNFGKWLLTPGPLEFLKLGDDFGFVTAVIVVGKLEKDQAEHWRRILAGLEIGISPEIIGSAPEILFQLFQLFFGHVLSTNRCRGSRSEFCGPVLLTT
jgi:hypothetical protein